jgi:hypothetical protein
MPWNSSFQTWPSRSCIGYSARLESYCLQVYMYGSRKSDKLSWFRDNQSLLITLEWCVQRISSYQFYSLWFNPTGNRTHDLPRLEASTITNTRPGRTRLKTWISGHYTTPCTGFEFTTLLGIGTDCTGSCTILSWPRWPLDAKTLRYMSYILSDYVSICLNTFLFNLQMSRVFDWLSGWLLFNANSDWVSHCGVKCPEIQVFRRVRPGRVLVIVLASSRGKSCVRLPVGGAIVVMIVWYNYLCNQCLSPIELWIRTPCMAWCTRYNIMW